MLFEAFKLVFKTNRKIENDGKYWPKFSVSSSKDLGVVAFFSALPSTRAKKGSI